MARRRRPPRHAAKRATSKSASVPERAWSPRESTAATGGRRETPPAPPPSTHGPMTSAPNSAARRWPRWSRPGAARPGPSARRGAAPTRPGAGGAPAARDLRCCSSARPRCVALTADRPCARASGDPRTVHPAGVGSARAQPPRQLPRQHPLAGRLSPRTTAYARDRGWPPVTRAKRLVVHRDPSNESCVDSGP